MLALLNLSLGDLRENILRPNTETVLVLEQETKVPTLKSENLPAVPVLPPQPTDRNIAGILIDAWTVFNVYWSLYGWSRS